MLSGKFFTFDALTFETRTFNINRDATNPLNGKNPVIKTLIDYEAFCELKKIEEKPLKEISVKELHEWQLNGEIFQLIDVREPHEYLIANLDAELIPLGTILLNANKIDKEKKVVIHCKMGGRSAKAIRQLQEEFGFDNIYNLKGGIIAWIDEIQPELTKY